MEIDSEMSHTNAVNPGIHKLKDEAYVTKLFLFLDFFIQLHINRQGTKYTVPTFNSCTKYVGSRA